MFLEKMNNKQLEAFIADHHILTIATTDGETAWSAPVYYVYFKRGFYFFSKIDSRHIVDSEIKGGVGASIHTPAQGWRDIKGLQMQGAIFSAGTGTGSRQAFEVYQERFAFLNELPGSTAMEMITLKAIEASLKVKWYRFIPEKCFFIDNAVCFGKRVNIVL